MSRITRGILAVVCAVLTGGAWAITETWTGTFSNTDPVKVFSEVTSLAQLKELAAAGQLGGKMGGAGYGGLQKTFGAVVFDSETATSVTYQMQVNDFRGDNDKHLKVCWVEFIELDGGIGAKQTNQCYCNNQGPTLLGQKITTSSTGYNTNTFDNYKVVEFKIVENPLDAKTTNIMLWLDASAEGTYDVNANGKVTKWKSVHDAGQYAIPTASSEADSMNNTGFKTNFGNYVDKTDIGDLGSIHDCDGKPAFDMGGIASGVDMSYGRKTTIRTVFWVMDIVSNGNAFFLGDSSSYDFHRNGANYANSQGAFGNASCKIWCDGVRVASNQGTAVPTGRHVFATVTHKNFSSNHLSLDRNVTDGNGQNGSRHGGRKLSELVIIDTPLSDAEVATTMLELRKKWMGLATYEPEGDCTISDIKAALPDATEVIVTMKPETMLTIDTEDFAYSMITVKSAGTITVAGTKPSDATLAKIDTTGVQGFAYHVWNDATAKVIALNLNAWAGNADNTGTSQEHVLAGGDDPLVPGLDLPAAAWVQNQDTFTQTTPVTIPVWDCETKTTTEQAAKATWSSANRHAWRDAKSKILRGYLDDSTQAANCAKVTVTDIPFAAYDVLIFGGTDTGMRGGVQNQFSPYTVNGTLYKAGADGLAVAAANDTDCWGATTQPVPAMGVNVLRVNKLAGPLAIVGGRNANNRQRGGIAAVVIIEAKAEILDDSTAKSVSAANALGEAEIINIHLNDGETFTVDAAPTRRYNLVSDGSITITGTDDARTFAALSQLSTSGIEGTTKVEMTAIPDGFAPVYPTAVYRFEQDYSAGLDLNYGAATYEFKAIKITNNPGSSYTIQVREGDSLVLPMAGQYSTHCDVSVKVMGGEVQFGPDAGSQAIWYGVSNVGFTQAGGTVNVTANGTGGGNGNGFLLGWSGALSAFDFTGGTFNLPNSRLNFWSAPINMNVSGTATVKIKGLFAGSGSTHTATLADTAVIELGSLGWANVPLTITGSAKLKAVESTTMSNAITLADNAAFEIVNGATLTLSGAVTGARAITATGAGTLGLAGTAMAGTLGAVEGDLKFVASAAQLADGVITMATTQDNYDATAITVVNEAGDVVEHTAAVADGVLTLTLSVNSFVDENTSTVDWDEAMTGDVSIKNTGDEATTLTIGAAIPAGVTAIKVFGKVDVAFTEGAVASEIPVQLQAGAEVTASGAVKNPIAVPAGTTLTVAGETSSVDALVSVTGGEVVIDGTVTANARIVIPNGSTLTVKPGATLNLTLNEQFSAAEGNSVNGTYNIYGTLNLGSSRLNMNNAHDACWLNLYAGSIMTGTDAAWFNMTGGWDPWIYIKAYPEAENQFVTFDVHYGHGQYNSNPKWKMENGSGVGLKILKTTTNSETMIQDTTNVGGLELAGTVMVKMPEAERGLRGAVVIGAGTKVTLTRNDSISYDQNPKTTFDIAGILDCGAFRQTLFADNTITLRDGGQITGAGADYNSEYTAALDVCRALTIKVAGTATIAGPVAQRDAGNVITIAPVDAETKGTLVLSNPIIRSSHIDLQPGAQVQLPSTVDASKVITTARGKMIVAKPAATEGQTIYRTANKSFTFIIK